MNLKRFFFIIVVLILTLPVKGFCLDAIAHVDKTTISREDSVFLKVVVSGGKADLDFSRVKQFKVIPRGSSSSYNYINGNSERKATYQYVLLPLEKGSLTIPPIKVTRDKDTAFTQKIAIHVVDQVVKKDNSKAIFATSTITKDHLFVGEQAVYTLKFFTSKRLSGLGFEHPPEFKNFSSRRFEKEQTYTQTINGVLFQITQLDYIIVPSTSGTFTIDPAVLIANVLVKTNRNPSFDSIFDESFFSSNRSRPVSVSSNPVKIQVSMIPDYTGEGDFSGLVGRFDIKGDMDRTSLMAGESATFTIIVSGTGNIMDAGLPKMDLDTNSFKVYDDNPVESVKLTLSGYEGSKIFKKAIVPVNPGAYIIKNIGLTYFDVDEKRYKKIETKEIKLDVTPSEQMHTAKLDLNSEHGKSFVKQEVSLVNKDILEIKEGLEVLENYEQINPIFFVFLLSIPGILFCGVKLFTLVAKRDITDEKLMEEKAKHHFKQAQKLSVGDENFLGHIYSGLTAFVQAKGKKKGEAVTLSETRQILSDSKMDDDKIDQIVKLFETIESVRFGGNKIDEIKARDILSKSKKLIKFICLAMICFNIFSFIPQKAMANPTAAFIDGINFYKAGDFKEAAKAFEAVAKSDIKNPYLFYNIANAYLKDTDLGHAILWYERAKLLAPNNPDLIFNLEYANTMVKDKQEMSINMMDILFFWDNLIPVKTIQITAVFFSFVFFIWACFRVVKKHRIFSGMGIVLFSILVFFTSITCVNYYKQLARLNAVIINDEVAIRSGVNDTSTELFSLNAGSKVSVKEQRDGYLKIKFAKGKIGWVKAKNAIII